MALSTQIPPEATPRPPDSRGNTLLGPSDSSDSGSDRTGVPGEVDSDAGGTGERISVDASETDAQASDIGVDHTFTPGRRSVDPSTVTERLHDDDIPDLDFVDVAMAPDPLDDSDVLDDPVDEDIPRPAKRFRPARPEPAADHP
jgi:hypothetical protein